MDFPSVPVDLALLEPIDVLAGRSFHELRRKDTPQEEDGIVEPKQLLTVSTVAWVILAALALIMILLAIAWRR